MEEIILTLLLSSHLPRSFCPPESNLRTTAGLIQTLSSSTDPRGRASGTVCHQSKSGKLIPDGWELV